MNPRYFFAELKRRNVYKVAVAYAVSGWLLIQIATQVFPFFEIPDWAVRLVVLLIIIGFPGALVLAWAFELTPEGLKRTEPLGPKPDSSSWGRSWIYIAGVAGALSMVLFFLGRFTVGSKESGLAITAFPGIPAKSIAVLPFENRSEDKANAYFADGIQDEILTRLSKIADLTVISRTSSQHYKSMPENLREIGRQLGVAYVVEGSVQKSGEAVRVNVQLIKAANDSHIWAETFDRNLTDIFLVESEIAKTIAAHLQAKLTGREGGIIAARPTDNSEAYDAYLHGLAYTLKPTNDPVNASSAQNYLRDAVRLDPSFALAWALLSKVNANGYLTTVLEATTTLREEAREAAETALRLQPTLGEALEAKGNYYYACLKDYDTAVGYFEEARQFLPNNSSILASLARVARRRGQWERSDTYYSEAERLDPRNVYLLTQHAITLIYLQRFPEALGKSDRVLAITPNEVSTIVRKATIAQAEGDLSGASALLAPLRPNGDDSTTLEIQTYQAILERHPAPMIARLTEILAEPDPMLGHSRGELRFFLGWAQQVAGDHATAQESWRLAQSELELTLREQPGNWNAMQVVALTAAGLGDKRTAFGLAEQEMAKTPVERDALNGPYAIEIMARVAAQLGEPDRAIEALEHLLSVPHMSALAAPITPALLKLDPMFDSLRDNPRFQELLMSADPSKGK